MYHMVTEGINLMYSDVFWLNPSYSVITGPSMKIDPVGRLEVIVDAGFDARMVLLVFSTVKTSINVSICCSSDISLVSNYTRLASADRCCSVGYLD